jgi:hypothetical protein
MWILGLKYSKANAESKPSFNSVKEAEQYYFKWLNNAKKCLNSLAIKHSEYNLNYTLESIKEIELLYFDLLEKKKYKKRSVFGLTKSRMEDLISVYCNEVLVKHYNFKWKVSNYLWYKDKYQLSVVSKNGGFSIAAKWVGDHSIRKDNKRKQALFRDYKKYSEYGH